MPDKEKVSLEEIAERCVREWVEHDLDEHFESGYDCMITMKPEDLIERVLSALRNERERACRLICPFCSNSEYDLVWHHEEWRHYRKADQHIQYCQASVLRGTPSGKETKPQ